MVPKVSIIVPVYNNEEFLEKCIESLMSQTLQLCEFIFINDGSEDSSKEIIKYYQKHENRIILINQENQGVSVARNSGLKAASGEYVGFIDADDFVEIKMYELMYYHAKESNCDVILTNIKNEMERQTSITTYPFPKNKYLNKDFIKKELLPYFLKEDNLNSVVNKLYRNKVIKENNIMFPKGIALGEDGIFNIRFLSKAESIKYLDYAGYHYREVKGSATRSISANDYFNRALEVYNMEIPEIMEAIHDISKIKRLKSIKLIQTVMSLIHVYLTPTNEMSLKERYKYVKKMVHNQEVQKAIYIYEQEIKGFERYERFILQMIKREFCFGLYAATAYSRFRNR